MPGSISVPVPTICSNGVAVGLCGPERLCRPGTRPAPPHLVAEARVRTVMSLPERRVGAQRQQGGQPRPGPVQHRHSLVGGGDLDVDVAAAGELLVRGQAEVLGHPLIPAGADRSGLDGDRRGAQRGHLGPGPAGRRGGRRPALAHLAVQVIQGLARPRVGFQLLLLQFGFQVRSGGSVPAACSTVPATALGRPVPGSTSRNSSSTPTLRELIVGECPRIRVHACGRRLRSGDAGRATKCGCRACPSGRCRLSGAEEVPGHPGQVGAHRGRGPVRVP